MFHSLVSPKTFVSTIMEDKTWHGFKNKSLRLDYHQKTGQMERCHLAKIKGSYFNASKCGSACVLIHPSVVEACSAHDRAPFIMISSVIMVTVLHQRRRTSIHRHSVFQLKSQSCCKQYKENPTTYKHMYNTPVFVFLLPCLSGKSTFYNCSSVETIFFQNEKNNQLYRPRLWAQPRNKTLASHTLSINISALEEMKDKYEQYVHILYVFTNKYTCNIFLK